MWTAPPALFQGLAMAGLGLLGAPSGGFGPAAVLSTAVFAAAGFAAITLISATPCGVPIQRHVRDLR